MLKIVKQISLLNLFAIILSCSGAENPKPTTTLKSILKNPDSSAPKKSRVHFHNGPSTLQEVLPEKVTVEDRLKSRIKAQQKKQKLNRQQLHSNARSLAAEESNIAWGTNGSYNPHLYDNMIEMLEKDEQERLEKLQALTNILEIETETASALAVQERLEKENALKDAYITIFFMRAITALENMRQERISYFLYNYPQESTYLMDYILNKFIKEDAEKFITEDTITDAIMKETPQTKIGIIHKRINLLSDDFQKHLRDFLEERDYSLFQPVSIAQPDTTKPNQSDSTLVEFSLDG